MRSTLGRLFVTATIAACLGLAVVSATGVEKTYGATNKAATRLTPICGFSFTSQYAPSSGETSTYTLSFAVCRTGRLTVQLVPGSVRKVAGEKQKPTRRVHGNPVGVNKVSW